MPSRADMDRPAIATVAVLGVLLIAVSVPFLRGGGEGTAYGITWAEASAGRASNAIGPQGSPQDVTVPVRHVLVSTAVVHVDPCADTAQPPVQMPAVLAFELFYENETALDHEGRPIARDDVTCDNAGPFEFTLAERPDVAARTAESVEQAERDAYGDGNRTGTYRLEYRWERAGGVPLPLPVGQPAFTGTVELEVLAWRATAQEPGQEVPR